MSFKAVNRRSDTQCASENTKNYIVLCVCVCMAGVDFPVDGDPYCTLTQYWALVEVG